MFIRGIKSNSGGIDSFKFVLEKLVDFAQMDADLVLGAVEHLLKMQPDESAQDQ